MNAGYGFGFDQDQGQGYYPTPEQETALARAQMFDSVHHLSTSLRNAANQCDNFVKVISRHHPSAAATNLAASISSDFMAIVSGTGLAGLPPAIIPTSRKNMTKEERRALKKHRKLTRDPNAPKRPPSAYLLFQNEIREDMRHQFKDLSYAEVLGKISEAWKGLSDDQRKVYQDRTIEMMKDWNSYRRNQQNANQQAANAFQQMAGAGDEAANNQLLAANGAAAANVLQGLAPAQAQHHHAAAAATIAAAAAAQQAQQQQSMAQPASSGKRKPKHEKKSRK